uniref:Uncharacterized protein n=1 Tax=Lynx canadensis TaxID=61383 RepID=A0A667H220_LYNCA
MICNVLGVNAAKSGLLLRFLKTLEFGTTIPEPSGLAPIAPWRGKLVIWLYGEGSTLCSYNIIFTMC